MFRYIFICLDDPLIDNELVINIVKQFSAERKKLSFETCELGKNINIKYHDVIKKFEETEKQKMNDYKCINYNGRNLRLYSHPSMSREKEFYLNLELSTKCKNFDLLLRLITQNDFIDHLNKDNPIVSHYLMNNIYVENIDKLYLTYNYQFIKYETDNGILFSN